jgi:hypothetical protein
VVTQVIIGFRVFHLGIIIVSYVYAKKRIKPLFSDIEVIDKDLYIKK